MRTTAEVKAEFEHRGISISDWARRMGFSAALVHHVLAGRLACRRGQSHAIAVRLGLKHGVISNISDLDFSVDKEVCKIQENN